MRYRHLLTGLTLLGLLVPSKTAWPGGGAPNLNFASVGRERELFFKHVCQSEPHKGRECKVSFQTIITEGNPGRMSCGCSQNDENENQCAPVSDPEGEMCAIHFFTPVIKGTLFLIAQEDVQVEGGSSAASTVLLSVTKDDGQIGFFSDISSGLGFCPSFNPVEQEAGLAEGAAAPLEKLFLVPSEAMAKGLRAFFFPDFLPEAVNDTSFVPVIVKEESIIESPHFQGDDPHQPEPAPELASVFRLRIGFRFAQASHPELLFCTL